MIRALIALLISGCLITSVEGDPSPPRPGEAYICGARVTCGDEEPANVQDDLCGPLLTPWEMLAKFVASLSPCIVEDPWCVGVGDPSVGGTGEVELCFQWD